MSKTTELREKSVEELSKDLIAARDELFHLRFQLASSQLDSSARIKDTKKKIARIETVLRQIELAETSTEEE